MLFYTQLILQSYGVNDIFFQDDSIDKFRVNQYASINDQNKSVAIINQKLNLISIINGQTQNTDQFVQLEATIDNQLIKEYEIIKVSSQKLVVIDYEEYYIIDLQNLANVQKNVLEGCMQLFLSKEYSTIFYINKNNELFMFNDASEKFDQIIIDGFNIVKSITHITAQYITVTVSDPNQAYTFYDIKNRSTINFSYSSQSLNEIVSDNVSPYYQVIISGSNLKTIYSFKNYPNEPIKKYSFSCLNSCNIDLVFELKGFSTPFVLIQQKDYFSFTVNLISDVIPIISTEDEGYQTIFSKHIKPCVNSNTMIDEEHLYYVCPYSTHVYDLQTMKFIQSIKYLVSDTSYMKSIKYISENIYLIIANNKLEVYELDYKYRQKIAIYDKLINPQVYDISVSINLNKEISIKIHGVSSFNIFKIEIIHKSAKFQDNLIDTDSQKIVKVVIDSENDFNKNIVVQNSLSNNLKTLRYKLIFTKDSQLNPFPVISDNFFKSKDFIEYQGTEDSASLIKLVINNSNFLSSYIVNLKFSNMILNFEMGDEDQLDLNKAKQLKQLQFSSMELLNSQNNKIINFHDLSILVLNELTLNQQTIQIVYNFKNIDSIIINNLNFNNVNHLGLLNFFNFIDIGSLTLRNVTFDSCSFTSYAFSFANVTTSLQIDNLVVQRSTFKQGIFYFYDVQQLLIEKVLIEDDKPFQINGITALNVQSYAFYLNQVDQTNIIDCTLNKVENIGLIFYEGYLVNFNPSTKIKADKVTIQNSSFKIPMFIIQKAVQFEISNIDVHEITSQNNSNLFECYLIKTIKVNSFKMQKVNYISPKLRLLASDKLQASYIFNLQGIENTEIADISFNKVYQIGLISLSSYQASQDIIFLSSKITILGSQSDTIINSIADQSMFKLFTKEIVLNNFNITNSQNSYHILESTIFDSFTFIKSYLTDIKLDKSSTTIYAYNSKSIIIDTVSFSSIQSHIFTPSLVLYGIDEVKILNGEFTKQVNQFSQTDNLADSMSDGALNLQKCNNISIVKTNFKDNSSFKNAGCIFFLDNTLITITDSQFLSNTAFNLSGGAIYVQNSQLEINNSIFEQNFSLKERGGAIYSYNSPTNLKGTTKITNNYAIIGGGIYYNLNSKVIKESTCTISQNVGIFYGNNLGSLPKSIKKYDPITKQQQNMISMVGFQSGNYTKENIYVQFYDEEDNKLDFSLKKQKEKYSDSIQSEIDSYKILIQTDKLSEDISISAGQSLTFDQSTNHFKLNFTASYKTQRNFIVNLITNLPSSEIFLQIDLFFRLCEIGEIKYERQDFIQCDQCSKGTYSLADPNIDTTDIIQCKKCPDEASQCLGRYIFLKDNYWRESEYTDDIYSCNTNGCSQQEGNIEGCVRGYMGPICQKCDIQGEYWIDSYGSQGNQCLRCSQLYLIYIIMSFTIVFYIIYIHFSLNSQIQQKTSVVLLHYFRKLNMLYLSKSKLYGSDSGGLTKVFLHYIQIFSSSIDFYQHIPLVVKEPVAIGGDPTKVTFNSYDCFFLNTPIKLLWINRLLMQLAQILVTTLIVFIIEKKINRKQNKRFYKTIYAVFLYIFYYPSITKLLISLCWCRQIGSHFYLNNDLVQQCWTKSHILVSIFIIYPLAIIWSLIIPFVLYVKMRNAMKNKQNETIKYILSYYLMQQGYKDKLYYWELVKMFQKFLIMFILNSSFTSLIQRLIIAIICFVYLQLVQALKPIIIHSQMKCEILLGQIILFSLILQSMLDSQSLSQEFISLIISILIIINAYGVIKVIMQFLKFYKEQLSHIQDESKIKIFLLKFKYFQKLFKKKNVSQCRVSWLWKIVHYKIVKKNRQIPDQITSKKESTLPDQDKQPEFMKTVENMQQVNANTPISAKYGDTDEDLIKFQQSERSIIDL